MVMGADVNGAPPALRVDGLAFSYPDGTAALGGVAMTVAPGERVALLGPNGAGKSTLILHLNGILMPRTGTVSVEGVELTAATVREVRAKVGLVFQDPDDQLFMTTVYDDVAFGPLNMGLDREQTELRVREALEAVGLSTAASKPGANLSFGQRKRAALATVIAMRPAILVLDEPTSNLDPRARRDMETLLRSMDVTLVVATHDMDVAWRLCDRAVVLDGGMVVADGPVAELLADEALLLAHGLELPPLVAAARSAAGTIAS